MRNIRGTTLDKSYVWGMDLSGSMQEAGGVGGLLAVTDEGASGGPVYYPAYDGNGNVTENLKADGTAEVHFKYDPFGRLISNSDSGEEFPIRFSTKMQEDLTRLYYYGESLLDTRGGPYKPTTDFACTRKDKTIYLHYLKRSGDVIKLPALPAKIVSAKLLTGGEVKASQTATELSLTLAPKNNEEIDVIVKLELDKVAMDIAPIDSETAP